MYNKDDQDAVKAALIKELTDDIHKYVPGTFQGFIPTDKIPFAADRLAYVALDTVNKRHMAKLQIASPSKVT